MTYEAFISYSHAADDKLAPALQSALHRFAKPFYRLRSLRLFRDKSSLQLTPELWPVIKQALAASEYFLLMASPEAANSPWVQAEVDEWLRLHGGSAEKLLLVLTDGEAIWKNSANDFDWESTTGKTVAELDQTVLTGFSPNGKWLITAKRDHSVCVREVGSWRTITELLGHTSEVGTFVFSPNGKWLVTASSDRTTIIWEVETWRSVDMLLGQGAPFVMFSANGRVLITTGADDLVSVWQAGSWKLISTLRGHFKPVGSLSVSPDGQSVITSHYDRFVRVWALNSDVDFTDIVGARDGVFGHPPRMLYSPDSRRIAITDRYGVVNLVDVETSSRVPLGRGEFLAFSPDSKYVFTKNHNLAIQVWDASTRERVIELRGHTNEFNVDDHTNDVTDIAFSPDGRWIVTAGGSDRTARVWEAVSWRSVAVLQDTFSVDKAVFSPDGEWLITAGEVGHVWKVGTWKEVTQLRGYEGEINSISFSPNGSWLLTTDWLDDRAWLWTVGTWQNVLLLQGHSAPLEGAEFSPNGRQVLTWGKDNTARVWDARTGDTLANLPGDPARWRADHPNKINSASFSPDGKLIQIASGQTVRIWTADTGMIVTILSVLTPGKDTDNGPRTVNGAIFSPNGRSLLAVTNNGVTRLYPWEIFAPFDELLKIARMRTTRDLTPDEMERYMHVPAGPQERKYY